MFLRSLPSEKQTQNSTEACREAWNLAGMDFFSNADDAALKVENK